MWRRRMRWWAQHCPRCHRSVDDRSSIRLNTMSVPVPLNSSAQLFLSGSPSLASFRLAIFGLLDRLFWIFESLVNGQLPHLRLIPKGLYWFIIRLSYGPLIYIYIPASDYWSWHWSCGAELKLDPSVHDVVMPRLWFSLYYETGFIIKYEWTFPWTFHASVRDPCLEHVAHTDFAPVSPWCRFRDTYECWGAGMYSTTHRVRAPGLISKIRLYLCPRIPCFLLSTTIKGPTTIVT